MLLPIRTSISPRRTPYMNYALIALNVLIFMLSYQRHINPYTRTLEILRPWAQDLMLTTDNIRLWQFITYAFLHGGLGHILGNMYFLWLFGNNVNDRLGHFGYLCFYLAGAAFSAVGHLMLGGGNVLGASGAVAAVTGAYLVLFPQSLITVFYWLFWFIGSMEISALYFIALKLIFIDNVLARYYPNVAYDAHLAGYLFGMLAMGFLLSVGILKSQGVDMLSILIHYNRRRKYRNVVAAGYDPFAAAATCEKTKPQPDPAREKLRQQTQQLKSDIGIRIAQHNMSAAAALYQQLVELDDSQLLGSQQQLDIANQLASEGSYRRAADAYEKFLAHYKNYQFTEQVQLMTALIYSRYLDEPERAVDMLRAALEKLTDPAQIKMCNEEIKKIEQSK